MENITDCRLNDINIGSLVNTLKMLGMYHEAGIYETVSIMDIHGRILSMTEKIQMALNETRAARVFKNKRIKDEYHTLLELKLNKKEIDKIIVNEIMRLGDIEDEEQNMLSLLDSVGCNNKIDIFGKEGMAEMYVCGDRATYRDLAIAFNLISAELEPYDTEDDFCTKVNTDRVSISVKINKNFLFKFKTLISDAAIYCNIMVEPMIIKVGHNE